MKTFLTCLSALLFTVFNSTLQAAEIITPGEPAPVVTTTHVITTPVVTTTPVVSVPTSVPVETAGGVYYPAATVTTEVPYYYTAENKVCYSQAQPGLTSLNTYILNVAGVNQLMYCYPSAVTSTPVENYYGASE